MTFTRTERRQLRAERLEVRRLLAGADPIQTLFPSTLNPQPGAQGGYSTAASDQYHVVAKPYADVNYLMSGAVDVFDAITHSHLATINNPSPANYDYFGSSVALSGTTLVVGAKGDDTGATRAGSVYVFDLTSGIPVLFETLNNPTPEGSDLFGESVAISGSIVVVGAEGDESGAFASGSAYVYDVSGGSAVLLETINNPEPSENDRFGNSVAVSGDRVVVGAHQDDTTAYDAGSVYVYDLSGGSAVLTQTLNNPDFTDGRRFGSSVAVDGDTVVVGAPDGSTAASGAGIAYVYDLQTGAAVLTSALVHPTASPHGNFGASVAIKGDRLIIGTPLDDTTTDDAGSAFVYELSGGTAVLFASIDNPAPGEGDQFGFSVAVSGDTVLVSAHLDDTFTTDSGSTYVYDLSGGATALVATIQDPVLVAASGDGFGVVTAISGDILAVAAPGDDRGGLNSGIVYLYDLGSGNAVLFGTIQNPSTNSSDGFGSAIAISGDTIVIGAYFDETDAFDTGRAYVYDVSTGSPVLTDTLINPSPENDDWFGYSVAISGDVVVVSAPRDNTGTIDAGSVYVYGLNGGIANLSSTINNPTPAFQDGFGNSVAISDDTIVIGALYDNTGGADAGSAYVYDLTSGNAVLLATIDNPNPASDDPYGDQFGAAVAVSGSTVVISAPRDDSDDRDVGIAYVYDVSGGGAALRTTVNNPATEYAGGDTFGAAVAISGDRIVIGASYGNFPNTLLSGIAYVFDLNAGNAELLTTLGNPSSIPETWDYFGTSVSISGDIVVVGASSDNTRAEDAGAAFVYSMVPSVVVDINSFGQLTITGDVQNGVDDLTIRSDGSNLVIYDAKHFLTTMIAGAGGDATHTLTVPLAAFAGDILVDTLGGNDALTVDYSTGNFDRQIQYEGGADDNSLLLVGGTFVDATFTDMGADSGIIDVSGNPVITYARAGSITSGIGASNVTLNHNAASETITVSNAGNEWTRVDSTRGKMISFANPDSSLTINAGDTGDDVINLVGLIDGFAANLTIEGGTGTDIVNIAGKITLDGRDLTVTSDSINVFEAVNTGGGNISFAAVKGVTLEGAVATEGGAITIDADSDDDGVGLLTVKEYRSGNWLQRGTDIDGEAAGDKAGFSVALSDDSQTLAVGAINNGGNGNISGQVRVFDWNGSFWVQRGTDIDGEAAGDQSGYTIALSDDGDTVVIGAGRNDGNGSNSGHVRVFDWNGTEWIQRGMDIDGEAAGDAAAFVAASDDGSTIVVGAPSNDDNGDRAGNVRVFDWSGTSWVQRGLDVDGKGAEDQLGAIVSISGDGNVLIARATYDVNSYTKTFRIRAYEWTGSAWVQRGNDIGGDAVQKDAVWQAAISGDGNTLVAGEPYDSTNAGGAGRTRVYDWNGASWEQRGADIYGESTGDHAGGAVAIHDDGNTIVVGATQNSLIEGNGGEARVFDWNGLAWVQRGVAIEGEATADSFGFSVATGNNGNSLIAGATFNDGNGNGSGHARVFDWVPVVVGTLSSSGGNATIVAAAVNLEGAVDVGAGSITFVSSAAEQAIDLGSAEGDHQFVLTDAELDQVTTTNKIVIGGADAGDVVITGMVRLANAAALEIVTGGAIRDADNAVDLIVPSVTLVGTVAPGQSTGQSTGQSPGQSTGQLRVIGQTAFQSENVTAIEIGGTVQGIQYDSILAVGTLAVTGDLDVQLIDGFVPTVGDSFLLASAIVGISGAFDELTLPDPPEGSQWELIYNSNEIRLDLQAADVVHVIATSIADDVDGVVGQRSQVSKVQVTFSGAVDIDPDAFSVVLRGVDDGEVGSSFDTTTDDDGNTIATIVFDGTSLLTRGSQNALVDGNYQLTIDANMVRRAGTMIKLDGDGDGNAGGNYELGEVEADNFFARFGDIDGSRTVAFNEYFALLSAYGMHSSQTGYNARLDFDGDGWIAFEDYLAFRSIYSIELEWL